MLLTKRVVLLFIVFATSSLLLKSAAQCFIPVGQRIVSTDTNGLSLSWTHVQADSFEIEIREISNQSNISTFYKAFSNNITISNLKSGTAYDYRIRAFCPNGSISNWTIRLPFSTVIINALDPCDLGIPLLDRNCGNNNFQEFKILVTDFENRRLGVDINLLEVRAIISHSWPSDLKIQLTSPSGKTTELSRYNGLGRDHFGDPSVPDCGTPVVFTPLACQRISDTQDPFIGSFLPEGSFEVFNDSSSPSGIWTLSICDTVETDIGVLQHIKLQFTDDACIPPLVVNFRDIGPDYVEVELAQTPTCDYFWLECVPAGQLPGYKDQKGSPLNILNKIDCASGNTRITGLKSGTEYKLYARSECSDNTFSSNTCGIEFSTLCHEIAFRSGFDSLEICEAFCNNICELDSLWQNIPGKGLTWNVQKGTTPTADTGPESDVFGHGKYIYVEASDPFCLDNGPASIVSPCVQWISEDTTACDLSFHFHMSGISGSELSLELSIDEGNTWQTLWLERQTNNPHWQRVDLDLLAYRNQVLKLRFNGQPFGNLGDIGLDEISFSSGALIMPQNNRYYADKDNDTYGDPDESILSCLLTPPAGYVRNSLDCDDNNASVHPGSEEIPCNLIDDNCNGKVDDVVGSLEIQGIIIRDETCQGAKNGQIEVLLRGGIPPFQVRWSDGGTSLLRSNLAQGFYHVSIQDAAGCLVKADSIFIFGNEIFTIDVISFEGNTCPGVPNGTISLEGVGGEAPYFYAWSDGNFGNVRYNLMEGTYTVTVSDMNGCEVIQQFQITPSSTPQIQTLEMRQPSCPDREDGLIRIRVLSSKLPVQYLWSDGSTTSILRNIGPGIYSVTIEDADGCINTAAFTLTAPPPVEVQLTALDPITCPGGRNGAIKVKTSGGTPPFTYNWNNGLSFSKDLNGLATGHYNLTVTDVKNCKALLDSVFVREPLPFVLDSVHITDNKCLMTQNGLINVEISGGTTPYRYFWSTGATATTIDNLASGFYQLTITDLQDCKHTFPAFRVQSLNIPLQLIIDSLGNNLCFNNEDGLIGIRTIDAELPVEFHWSTGLKNSLFAASDTIKSLRSGFYGVTVTDQSGCIGIIDNIQVNGPTAPLSYRMFVEQPIKCHNTPTGAIGVMVEGGTSPYYYDWSSGSTESVTDQLLAGSYYCEISDANQCQIITQSIDLSNPSPIDLKLIIEEEACQAQNGSILAQVSGGTSPYDITWNVNNILYYENPITSLDCGTVLLQIEDASGCQLDSIIQLGSTAIIKIADNNIKIYPNPAYDWLFLDYDGHVPDNRLFISSLEGKVQLSYVQEPLSSFQKINISMLLPGMYVLHLEGGYKTLFVKL
jgi:hypothetical protein